MEQTTIFNPSQILLLQMFATNKSERGVKELKQVLYEHYFQRMNSKLENLWQSGVLDQERLDQIDNMDLHQLK
ncbi:MAG: hypothetical protein IJT97_10210 [Bacteroidaceae bacterium]|nr:hypothetical protein [Bacteroidaceae bacterium]